jgi:hypothetical protein
LLSGDTSESAGKNAFQIQSGALFSEKLCDGLNPRRDIPQRLPQVKIKCFHEFFLAKRVSILTTNFRHFRFRFGKNASQIQSVALFSEKLCLNPRRDIPKRLPQVMTRTSWAYERLHVNACI